IGELGLELDFFFIEFLLFVEATKEFLLSDIAFPRLLFQKLFRFVQLGGQGCGVLALEVKEQEQNRGSGGEQRQQVDGGGVSKTREVLWNQGPGSYERGLRRDSHPVTTMTADVSESCDRGHKAGCGRAPRG